MTQDKPNLTFPPVPFLAELRETILERSAQRMPKWRFRLASDLIAQIQPKAVTMLSKAEVADGVRQTNIRFDCRLLMTEEADPAMLEKTPKIDKPWWIRNYEIADLSETTWEIRRKGGMCNHNSDKNTFDNLEVRFRDVLAGGYFEELPKQAILVPQCLVCGRTLTDPASMARQIGPECAGSASLRVPRVFAATAV